MTIKNFSVSGYGGELLFTLINDKNAANRAAFHFAQYISAKKADPDHPYVLFRKTNLSEYIKEFKEKKELVLVECDNHHIQEGIFHKMNRVYNKLFLKQPGGNKRDSSDIRQVIEDSDIKFKVTVEIKELKLVDMINNHQDRIKEILNYTISEKDDTITSWALTSSNNTILLPYKDEKEIKEKLSKWLFIEIPHKAKKTGSLCYNTGIFNKDEPDNKILLYFFGGKNESGLDEYYMETYTNQALINLLKTSREWENAELTRDALMKIKESEKWVSS